jgi:hypothetical protein
VADSKQKSIVMKLLAKLAKPTKLAVSDTSISLTIDRNRKLHSQVRPRRHMQPVTASARMCMPCVHAAEPAARQMCTDVVACSFRRAGSGSCSHGMPSRGDRSG